MHREKILPSEKAFAYKLKMDALTHQGASRQLGEKWSVEQVADSASESARQIHRYAKYYNAQLEADCTPKGQPGIESITKQYLYQLAFQRFINDHCFTSVKNCFLLPTENNEIEGRGEASLNMLSAIGLQPIKVRFLPAIVVFEHYLSGRKMAISSLRL